MSRIRRQWSSAGLVADLTQLRALLAEWRARIRSEMPIARQMLRVLSPDRIVFSPDAAQDTVELRADCTVGSVFERLLVLKAVVTPAGYTRFWSVELRRILRVA
jgi:hypothetical protein